jgi:hypothetical protein
MGLTARTAYLLFQDHKESQDRKVSRAFRDLRVLV